jgi:hypothetical protein
MNFLNFRFFSGYLSSSGYALKSLLILMMVTLLFACKGKSPFAGYKPVAIGKPNQVDIVMDSSLRQSEVWDSIDYFYASAYPVMPAPEPFFDLRHLTMDDVEYDPYKKELKTLIFVADISDTSSQVTNMIKKDLGEEKWNQALKDPKYTYLIAKDKWAKGQLLVYLFANGKKELASAVRHSFPTVAARINRHDGEALKASLYGSKGKEHEMSALVKNKYGLSLDIPPYYVKALEEENFLWLRFDDKKAIYNFVFRKFPYTSESQFSKENLIRIRDEYGKQYIKTSSVDAYMRTNPVDLPVYEYEFGVNGIYGKEFRGIWETVNDFMGGPFFSYLLLNKNTNELVFIDAFVLAPGEDKRDMMQKLDYVVKNARF